MKYYFKENFRLLYADGSLYDENENAVYDYRNTTLLFPDIELYRDGEFIGHVKKNFTIFLREYDIYLGDELVDRLSQELTFFRSELTLQELGWKINGDFFASMDYADKGANVVATSNPLTAVGSAVVMNSIEAPTPTGIVVNNLPFVRILALAVAGLAFYFVSNRRKVEE